MRHCHSQDVLHIAAARIAGPYSIASIRPRNLFLRFDVEFHDNFSLRIESMHVAGLMIFRVRDKPYAIEPNRAHAPRIRRYLSRNSLFLHRRQRLVQVGDQVFLVLNAYGEPYQSLGDAQRLALFVA